MVQKEEFLYQPYVTFEGDGSQPVIEAESVLPTTAVPEIVGAGLDTKLSPETTAAVGKDSVVVNE